jgi:hypothetical protein
MWYASPMRKTFGTWVLSVALFMMALTPAVAGSDSSTIPDSTAAYGYSAVSPAILRSAEESP